MKIFLAGLGFALALVTGSQVTTQAQPLSPCGFSINLYGVETKNHLTAQLCTLPEAGSSLNGQESISIKALIPANLDSAQVKITLLDTTSSNYYEPGKDFYLDPIVTNGKDTLFMEDFTIPRDTRFDYLVLTVEAQDNQGRTYSTYLESIFISK